MHVLNLLRLEEFTGDAKYKERAVKAMQAFLPVVSRSPAAMSEMMLAIDFFLDAPKEVVLIVPTTRAEARPFLDVLARSFVPNRVLLVVAEPDVAELAKNIPLIASKVARGGVTTAYVCEGRVCELPTTDPNVFQKQLMKVRPLDGE